VTKLLQLDVGNSAIKWRLVDTQSVLARGSLGLAEVAQLADLLPAGLQLSAVWVSSVASEEANDALAAALQHSVGLTPWFARSVARSGTLVNSYHDPTKMGVDRWVAMLGARKQHSGALCVVDAGSALTIDLVSAKGEHEGGYIIPGPTLMERALLLDTDRVRFDEDVDYSLSPGKSTAEAVRHGIALAQAGAVLAIPDLAARSLVITGGGGAALAEFVNREHDLAPDLVFDGLAELARLEGQGDGS